VLYAKHFIDDLRDRADLVRRVSFMLIFLLAALSTGTAQSPAGAILVDEFSTLGCDNFLMRLDVYFVELSKDPLAKGVVVIRNAPSMRHRSVQTQEMIKEHYRWRQRTEPVDYVRADYADDPFIQLWRLPPGAVMPVIEDRVESFAIHESVRRPFMLGYEASVGGICPEIDHQQILAEFLKSHPKARGNIVVRAKSLREAQRKARTLRRKFETGHGISSARIRTFPAKRQKPENRYELIVEYWFLP
jgi:hypothetical protein